MGFLNHVKIWSDVLNSTLDEKAAPHLWSVHLGTEDRIYTDPVEFFRRTIITGPMIEALENIANVFTGKGGSKVLMLQSLFGGGKTHTLLTIYHALRKPTALLEAKTEDIESRKRIEKLVDILTNIGSIQIVVLDPGSTALAPTPVNPLDVPGGYRVQTLWGSLAHQLGRFGEVKLNDESLLPPPPDIIVKLLGDKPTLILADEIADYISRLKRSGDPRLQNYGDQVVAFMEYLAKAIELSRYSILVISIPIEEKPGSGIIVEERYKSSQDIILSLYRSISRVAGKRIVPVAPSDIPSILKVRIFEEIDPVPAKSIAATLTKIYGAEENKEIFGQGADRKAYQIEKTYPFHPSYIETLINIVDKHEGLQKTRDLIKLTRKIIRKIANENTDVELIMPFHIDVEDREIRSMLLSHELYRQYDTVVNEDIIEKTKEYEKPVLAKIIAKTIFVKSFVYAGLLEYRQIYPDKYDIAVSSYEPSTARRLAIQPKDYIDALQWLSNNLTYLLTDTSGIHYWFTQIASPIRRVEMVARTIDDGEALKVVKDYAMKLMARPISEVISSSRRHSRGAPIVTPFKVESSMVLTEPRSIDYDSRGYVVVAILSHLRDNDIEKMIYETSSGGHRRYANTVYLIYPSDNNYTSVMLGHAKRKIACDIVSEELGTLYRDEDIREVMEKKLRGYCTGEGGVISLLAQSILQGLNTVAYPSFDEQNHRNTFRITETSTGAESIVENVTRTLKSIKPQKYYEELDFETLEYLLSQVGIDISEGDMSRSVSDIIDYFYSNPRLPIVRETTVKDALIDGVKKLKIGIKKEGKIYYKKVYECQSRYECRLPSYEEGEVPSDIGLNDVVLPWRTALREQIEGLKGVKEEKVSGGIRRIWYAFYISGNPIPVDEALEKFDIGVLRESPLVRVVEFLQEGVDIKLDRYEAIATPGEDLSINIVVERIGSFKGDVTLVASNGSLSLDKIVLGDDRPSAIVEWRLRAPDKPGEYSYDIKVLNSLGETLRSAKINIIVKPKGIRPIQGVPPKGSKISMLEIEMGMPNLGPIRIFSTRLGSECDVEEAVLEVEAEIQDRRSKIALRLNNVTLDDVKSMFSAIVTRYGGLFVKHISYRVRLKPRKGDYVIVPEFSEADIKELENCKCITYYPYEE
ncbi:ATPase [Ignisphaera aggregans DSM 17230]|uniref:ATPase n=1 Tax=Ignisphaera aggregans (strain DSM 17230 / JCM 13409 / AQ1.S1) TaxID=583356 RepID=E0ST83_IGNAA|nr:ATPase [Ignisphaera aggregans DSM 17230]